MRILLSGSLGWVRATLKLHSSLCLLKANLRMTSAQSASQPTAVRTTKLASTVSSSSTVLIDRFADILEVAAPNNKDKYITAAETYQIDVHASAMVRAAEDLLSVTRKLKQLWILSEVREESGERNNGMEKRLDVADVAKELQRILRKEKHAEEMGDVQ